MAAFVRLGWRDRAWQATEFFFKDRSPQAWNQWAEVVSRTPRKPFFVGDLPHAWVASDFVRSALDMFAYTREADDSLVLAAGVPTGWLEGEGIGIDGRFILTFDDLQTTIGEPALGEFPAGGFTGDWALKSAFWPTTRMLNGHSASGSSETTGPSRTAQMTGCPASGLRSSGTSGAALKVTTP